VSNTNTDDWHVNDASAKEQSAATFRGSMKRTISMTQWKCVLIRCIWIDIGNRFRESGRTSRIFSRNKNLQANEII